jgi:RNA polymerase sigma-70 factor (ECF subfamily)
VLIRGLSYFLIAAGQWKETDRGVRVVVICSSLSNQQNHSQDRTSSIKLDPRADSCATSATLFLRLRPDSPRRELAWLDFHQRYAPIIAGFARNMGAKRQDIDDLIQEVTLGFFSRSADFTYDAAKGRFRGFLKVCTLRAWWKMLRRRRGDNTALKQIDPDDAAIEQVWNDVWEQENLRRALEMTRERYSSRPDRRRTFQAFEMSVLLEQPPQQVARELGMTVESVHQARTRVLRALREALNVVDEELG